MIIEGTINGNGLRAEYQNRFNEIKHHQNDILIDWTSRQGAIDFKGIIGEKALDLSELDLALLVSSGQIDFGGKCEKVGDTFSGVINLE